MNTLEGKIVQLESQDDLLLIKIKINENITISSIVIEDSNFISAYKLNQNVKVHFKETEVILSKDRNISISIQNKILGVVHSIQRGKILSEITIVFDNKKIKSIITTNACRQLNLQVNEELLALIKTNEISLSVYD